MARPPVFQKMNIQYIVPEAFHFAMREVEALMDFIDYYEVNATLVKPYFLNVHRAELESLSGYFNTDNNTIDFENLLAGQKDPENDTEQLTTNISNALKTSVSTKEDFSLLYLLKLQNELHYGLQHDSAGIGLRMETNSLFAIAEEAEKHDPVDKDLKTWLEDLLKTANTREIPALIRAWLFHYYFIALKPFEAYNDLLAYIICKRILATEKLDFFNTLNLEQFVFRAKDFLDISNLLAGSEDFSERMAKDLTPYLEACLSGFRNNISAIRNAITDCVRQQLDYISLSPRQKNSLNFWLEKAFYIHKEKLALLTPRQHEIMLLIAKYGTLRNKELVPVFMVDRKTIQRDFNTLLDLKLLEQRGGGRGLKYYINMRVSL